MNLSSLIKLVKDSLVQLAGKAVESFARAVAGWLMERVERLAASVVARLRGYAQRQSEAGVPDDKLSARVTDAIVDALDALRADLLRRRGHLTAEEALSMFEQEMKLPQLA